MVKLSYDLHIHSCLSPCADNDMLPSNVVSLANMLELDVIAVSDHNSCKNCKAVLDFAKQTNILAIPAMEFTTSEEIHVLCLFEELEAAAAFDNEVVYKDISKFQNSKISFGDQLVVDADDNILFEETSFLLGATSISIDNISEIVKNYNGIIIPAHVDRAHFSLLSNLGYIPDYCGFNTAEIKYKEAVDNLKVKHDYLNKCKIIHNSDAHSLDNLSLAENFIEVSEKSIKAVLDYFR